MLYIPVCSRGESFPDLDVTSGRGNLSAQGRTGSIHNWFPEQLLQQQDCPCPDLTLRRRSTWWVFAPADALAASLSPWEIQRNVK